jgi:hypothetical protein
VANANWLTALLMRVPPLVAALLAQMIVSVMFVPWAAASQVEFFTGAKRALVAGIIAHVIVLLFLLGRRSTVAVQGVNEPLVAGRMSARFAGWRLILFAFATVMVLALIGAISIQAGILAGFSATLLIVVVQQLVLAAVAFQVLKHAMDHDRTDRIMPKLAVICVLAALFSVTGPVFVSASRHSE